MMNIVWHLTYKDNIYYMPDMNRNIMINDSIDKIKKYDSQLHGLHVVLYDFKNKELISKPFNQYELSKDQLIVISSKEIQLEKDVDSSVKKTVYLNSNQHVQTIDGLKRVSELLETDKLYVFDPLSKNVSLYKIKEINSDNPTQCYYISCSVVGSEHNLVNYYLILNDVLSKEVITY